MDINGKKISKLPQPFHWLVGRFTALLSSFFSSFYTFMASDFLHKSFIKDISTEKC